MGWVYIKKDVIILKKDKRKFLKYLFNINKIKKVGKNYILLEKNKIKIWLKDIDVDCIRYLNNSKIKIENLAITKISENRKLINWAMNIDDSNVILYDEDFDISYSDIGREDYYPIKYKIKDIEIEQDKQKIQIKYDKKDSFLVYIIVDELLCFDNNKIRFSNDYVDWMNEKTMNIERLINTILKNNYCVVENVNTNYYEIDVKYKNEDIKVYF